MKKLQDSSDEFNVIFSEKALKTSPPLYMYVAIRHSHFKAEIWRH